MPSPVGHALGAIVAGWGTVPRRDLTAAVILALVACAPDLDLLAPVHRGPTHSVGATVLAGAITWCVLALASLSPSLGVRRQGGWDASRWAAAVSLAWGSHILLDWLSNDTRPPLGVMALWPFTHNYYKAGIEIFPPVSRHYWESRFWIYNLRALAFELLILGPIAAALVRLTSSRGKRTRR